MDGWIDGWIYIYIIIYVILYVHRFNVWLLSPVLIILTITMIITISLTIVCVSCCSSNQDNLRLFFTTHLVFPTLFRCMCLVTMFIADQVQKGLTRHAFPSVLRCASFPNETLDRKHPRSYRTSQLHHSPISNCWDCWNLHCHGERRERAEGLEERRASEAKAIIAALKACGLTGRSEKETPLNLRPTSRIFPWQPFGPLPFSLISSPYHEFSQPRAWVVHHLVQTRP